MHLYNISPLTLFDIVLFPGWFLKTLAPDDGMVRKFDNYTGNEIQKETTLPMPVYLLRTSS